MVAIDWTLNILDLATLTVVVGVLVVSLLRLRATRAAGRRLQASDINLGALAERVEALVASRDGAVSFRTTLADRGCLHEDSEVLDEGLVSKLAVAVSILIQHTELTQGSDKDPGVELLEAVRQSCLAVIETVWLKDLNSAYEASRRRRETLFKRCASVADLRERIHLEDAQLREDMSRLSVRLDEMLLATEGRYANASVKLTAALRRILR
jgi:hypothetical protein